MVSGRLEWMRSAFKITSGFKIIRPSFKPEPPGRNKPQVFKKIAGFREPFDFKEAPANSQGILNKSARLTLKRRPLLNKVQHYTLNPYKP